MQDTSLTYLIVLLTFWQSLSQLPSDSEWARARKCGSVGKFLDFTVWTASWRLPACVASCPPGSEALGAEPLPSCGEIPACVWPRNPDAGTTQLRFVLEYFCQESTCRFRGRWHAFQQRVSVKVAALLGIPLTEVNSELMYWIQTSGLTGSGPKLDKFLIVRAGEPGFPSDGGRQLSEGGYGVRVAFRIASTRISPRQRGVRLFEQRLPSVVLKHLGLLADVSNIDITLVEKPEEGVPYSEFASHFQFGGLEAGKLPRDAVLLGRKPECQDKCYAVNEKVNALGPGLCKNDCDCNGQRWCSHFGQCTGNTPSCHAPFLSDNDLTCTVGPVLTTATSTIGSTSTTTISEAFSQTSLRIMNSAAFPSIFRLPGSCGEAVLHTVGPCALGDHGCAGTACAVLRAAANEAPRACKEAVCRDVDDSNASLEWWEKQCSDARTLDFLREARLAGCGGATTALPSSPEGPGTTAYAGADMKVLMVGLIAVVAFSVCLASAWLFRRMCKCTICSALGRVCSRACCRFCPKSVRNQIGRKFSLSTGLARSSSILKGPPPETHWRAADGGLWWKGAAPSASSPNLDDLSETGSEDAIPGPSLPQRSRTQLHMGRGDAPPDPPRHSREKEKQPPRPRTLTPPERLSERLRRPVSASQVPSQPPSTTNSSRPSSAQTPSSRSRPAAVHLETPSRRMAWEKGGEETEDPFNMSQRSCSSSKGSKGTASTSASSPRNVRDSGEEPFAASGASPTAARKRASPSGARPKTPLQRPKTPTPSPPLLEVHSASGMVQHLRQLRHSTPANERRKIYRDLQLKWHPDKNVGDEEHATEMFKALQDNRSWFLFDENLLRPPAR